MKHITTKMLLAGAAVAGIASGGFLTPAKAVTNSGLLSFDQTSLEAGVLADDKEKSEDHSCKGKNTCKGKGGCKSGNNGCAGKNDCKGKGGCGMKDGKPTHEKK